MTGRTLLSITFCVLAVGGLYALYDLNSISGGLKMASASTSDLAIQLFQTSRSPATILVKVKNHSSSQTLTVLTWDSPLDPQAVPLGIVQVTSSETGEKAAAATALLSRLLPPPRDALVELRPGGEASNEVQIRSPAVELKRGTKYDVRLSGSWKAIWKSAKDAVTANDLDEMSGGAAVTGPFQSEGISIDVE